MALSAFGVETGAVNKKAPPRPADAYVPTGAAPASGSHAPAPPHKEGFYEKHTGAVTLGTAAATVAGVKGHRVGRAMVLGHHLGDTQHAAAMAAHLAPHTSAGLFDSQKDVFHRVAEGNKGVKHFRGGVDRYSRTFRDARAIKAEANQTGKKPNPILHPQRAEARLHADNMKRLISASDKKNTPTLHRGMNMMDKHKVGDTIEFGHLSSWTSNESNAHATLQTHQMVAAQLSPKQQKYHGAGAPEGSHQAVYHLPAGSQKAVNVSGATKKFKQNEWLTGGKHTVTHAEERDGVMHYTLKPHADNQLAKRAMTDTELKHRKRVQAGLATAGATIGLAALGARGGAAVARRTIKDSAKATRVADNLEHKTNTALAVGAGLGSIGGFNSASISRAEGQQRRPVAKGVRASYKAMNAAVEHGEQIASKVDRLVPSPKKAAALYGGAVATGSGALAAGSYAGSKAGARAGNRQKTPAQRRSGQRHLSVVNKSVDPLVRQYGLRGSPQGVDRDKRQQIWEARAKHLNRKRNRWDHTRKGAKGVEQAGTLTAGAAGAVVAGQQIRDSYKRENEAKFNRADMHVANNIRRHGADHPRAARAAAKGAQRAFHGKPGWKTLAVGGGAAATAAGARRLRIHAQNKTRKYSSASGGIASGTANRMKDYSVDKSAFGVDDPVSKADRRFNPAANTKPPLYLAQHTPAAAKLRQLKPAAMPKAAAIRAGLRATTIGKSAFGVDC